MQIERILKMRGNKCTSRELTDQIKADLTEIYNIPSKSINEYLKNNNTQLKDSINAVIFKLN